MSKVKRFLNNMFKRADPVQKRSATDGAGVLYSVGRDSPGVASASAMKISAVYRCTSILSGAIASIPLRCERLKDGVFVEDNECALSSLFRGKPNARMNAYEFVENIIIQMLSQGNAYVLIRRKYDEVTELVLLSPGSCNYEKHIDRYYVADVINGVSGVYASDQIMHIKNMSIDGGFTGVSTIRYGARVLGIAQEADIQTYQTYESGGRMRGFVSGGEDGAKGLGALDDDQISDVADDISAKLASGQWIFSLPDGANFHQLGFSPADTQLLQARQFSVLDICRFYGVHPDKAFAQQGQNYKASEMSQINFLTDTLQPIISKIEAEFNSKLIYGSLNHKHRIRFDISVLYRTDLATQSQYWKTLIEIGALTPNEVRCMLGRSALQGGDEAFLSCNLAAIKSDKIQGVENGNKKL